MEEKKPLHEALAMNHKKMRLPTNRLPLGQVDIIQVIASGYYADKTDFAVKLLVEGKPTFLIRPRRWVCPYNCGNCFSALSLST